MPKSKNKSVQKLRPESKKRLPPAKAKPKTSQNDIPSWLRVKKGDKKPQTTTRRVGVIDIGANSIRMVIAETTAAGKIEILDRLQRTVHLGQDTFRKGRLSIATMRAAISVLRDYRKLLDFYKVEDLRAVATSSVREAANADMFLDRVLMATGIEVGVIDTSEESRLTVSAVKRSLEGSTAGARNYVLVADVGGGSTLLTMLEKGEIAFSQSLRLGSIRLQESLQMSNEVPARAAELLRHHISNIVATSQRSLALNDAEVFVAVGGDARFAAREVGRQLPGGDLAVIEIAKFEKLIDKCAGHTVEELARAYGINIAEAETLNPALLTYQALLRETKARELIVAQASMRDGLLLELVRSAGGTEDKTITEGIINSALALAEKYNIDLDHAQQVADLAARLFDELKSEHGLAPRDRILLQTAALLHDIGLFVSGRAHHKHSYYLIANSEIFGIAREELQVIAQVARYHRRSTPKPTHLEYMTLPREQRMRVSKLAALLRVADALDAGRARQVHKLRCQREGEDLILHLAGASDLGMERRALELKGDLFADIFGLRLRIEEEK